MPLRRPVLLALLALFLLPSAAHAAGVEPLFDISRPEGAPFPSDRYTTPDATQLTGRRVALPKPSCASLPSDCEDVDVLNTLDGFNVQPRLTVPFTSAIDPASVTSDTVFLVRLPDGDVTGVNQVTWHPATNTLHVESDEQLDQHTTYLFVVTTGVRDAAGDPVEAANWQRKLNFGQTKSAADKAYRKALLDALELLPAGVEADEVAAASLFTTQSITALLEQVRGQIKSSLPQPASFLLGTAGERTVFPRAFVTSIGFNRQTTAAPPAPGSGTPLAPFPLLHVFGTVGTIAFGAYDSPDYETALKVIPAVGSKTGSPVPQGTDRIHFNLFLPTGPTPAGGWPVAIFGHGFTDNKNNSPFVVASSMAGAGIATIAINVVGHGGGALGTLTVNRAVGASVTFSAGGRGIDQNGDGSIGSTEGVDAAPPAALVSNRDGLRQTVIDLMQLVRQLELGMDVDGDGSRDLDPARIFYFGQSFGGIYGTTLLAVEPTIRVGVPNVPGGPIIEIARLSPSFRPLVWLNLVARTPPLPNLPGLFQFNENMPLRNLPPLVDTVPGAAAIQQVLERAEWAQQAANPAAFAPHLIERPLAGVPAKSIILQFARGDQTVPNPTTSAIIRAGNLQSRTTLFRNDLARMAIPALPANPHTFLTGVAGAGAAIALQAQTQIATFFASGGTLTVDPDGPAPFFETPMVGPPPETLGFP
jgi:Big-like domain-containing protein